MTRTSKAKIFLSDERGAHSTAQYSSRQTLNTVDYYNEHKIPVGDIYLVNEDTLAASGSITMQVQRPSYILLLPVEGAVTFNNGNAQTLVAAGQVLLVLMTEPSTFHLQNPFISQPVNVVQLWIRADPGPQTYTSMLQTFDVNEKAGSMVNLLPAGLDETKFPFSSCIGKFKGRDETGYKLQHINGGIFVFVLAGAFETEGRLLHAGDGLAFQETSEIDIEALSNDAILLLVEHW